MTLSIRHLTPISNHELRAWSSRDPASANPATPGNARSDVSQSAAYRRVATSVPILNTPRPAEAGLSQESRWISGEAISGSAELQAKRSMNDHLAQIKFVSSIYEALFSALHGADRFHLNVIA